MGYTLAANHSPMIIRLAASIFAGEISHGMLGDSTAVETSQIEEFNCRMSATSKGYYIQSLTSGKFMRSTVVVNPPELPPVLPGLPESDGDEYSPSYMAVKRINSENLVPDPSRRPPPITTSPSHAHPPPPQPFTRPPPSGSSERERPKKKGMRPWELKPHPALPVPRPHGSLTLEKDPGRPIL